jgi:hypothetical protein
MDDGGKGGQKGISLAMLELEGTTDECGLSTPAAMTKQDVPFWLPGADDTGQRDQRRLQRIGEGVATTVG